MCYKCGGTQDIPCADKNRHYLTSFIYAKNKFGVSCMTEDRRESSSLQMCFKLPATENSNYYTIYPQLVAIRSLHSRLTKRIIWCADLNPADS